MRTAKRFLPVFARSINTHTRDFLPRLVPGVGVYLISVFIRIYRLCRERKSTYLAVVLVLMHICVARLFAANWISDKKEKDMP